MEKIFVTQSGYEALLKRKEELVAELRASQFDKGKAAAGDSNSWHDNAEYDVHARNEMMLAEQVSEIMRLIESVSVVGDPESHKIVAVGHIITLQLQNGEKKRYEVGGYGEADLSRRPPKLSYNAPILCQFLGKPTGHRVTVSIRGEDSEYLLSEIQSISDASS